jgi:hypothetical protein
MVRWPHRTGYGGRSTEALRGSFSLCLIYNYKNEELSGAINDRRILWCWPNKTARGTTFSLLRLAWAFPWRKLDIA